MNRLWEITFRVSGTNKGRCIFGHECTETVAAPTMEDAISVLKTDILPVDGAEEDDEPTENRNMDIYAAKQIAEIMHPFSMQDIRATP
jgi:hypothetical protein